SQQISASLGAGGAVDSVGGSVSVGTSTGVLDYLDMNGDGFPDVVGSAGIQYTDPTGGLGSTEGSTPDGSVRASDNLAGNPSAGSAARTIVTGLGNAGPTGKRASTTADAGNDMPPLGVSGEAGGSDSDTQFDLIDINGDGLPDRAYDNGQVAINLGYRFD